MYEAESWDMPILHTMQHTLSYLLCIMIENEIVVAKYGVFQCFPTPLIITYELDYSPSFDDVET